MSFERVLMCLFVCSLVKMSIHYMYALKRYVVDETASWR